VFARFFHSVENYCVNKIKVIK